MLTSFALLLIPIDKELNYDHLASGLKAVLQNDQSAFDADRLQKYTGIILVETSIILCPC